MNSKRIVSMIGAAAIAASMALSGLPVCAAATTMPDGGQFDAAYYAATYPDVVAALGTDASALYRHYKTCGAKEGRQPYATGSNTSAAAAQVSVATGVALTKPEQKAAQTILNRYLSGTYEWADGCTWRMNTAAPVNFYYEIAPNPVFAIADLDGNGVIELWTSPNANHWDVYLLSTSGSKYSPTLKVVDRYDTASKTFWVEYDVDGYVVDLAGNTYWYAENDFTAAGSPWILTLANGASQTITQQQKDQLLAAYAPIATCVNVQPITAANINALAQ